eukprot:gb/GEZN01002330.1/.p1 GENE.gb/GEZN01002330.1/~~gb/GEZN01002330.1/.p1  ORF type:complete len:776 (+),score=60.83 gb/GEZN01002330.1/:50-2377(+)
MSYHGLTFSLFLLACLLHGVHSSEQVRVISPSTAASQFPPNGIVPEVPALFGNPPYGRTITAQIYYYHREGDQDGCFRMDTHTDPDWPAPGAPLILILDRGDCTFVTKVRNAQIAGAQAVIIIDNVAETQEPFMADDGTGFDIHIPSVLIALHDGQKLKASLDISPVTISMTWNIPAPDAVVEWTYWTSSNDPASTDLKAVFSDAVMKLDVSSTFTAHYYILNGSTYGCHNTGQCGSQCINNGLYCAIDPDNSIDRGVSGAQVIEENLRQICIYRTVNTTKEYYKWWDYVSTFQTDCAYEQDLWSKTCSDQVLLKVEIDAAQVHACVTRSQTGGDTNTVLDEEVQKLSDEGIFFLPTIIINGVQYRGTLACQTPLDVVHCGVLEAICSGYASGTQPCACDSTPGCGLCEYRDDCGICGGDGSVDACGNCVSVASASYNQSCSGCDGIPNSGKKLDKCGVCGGTGTYDKCFRCLQANHPDRVDDGGYDPCGICLKRTDPAWGMSCAGCDGVANSGKVRDPCGVCDGKGSFDACFRCLQPGDPSRIEFSTGGFDACGVCMRSDDKRWNKTCAGCDGKPNSGKTWDQCGACGGTGTLDKCRRCLNADDPTRIDNGGYDACGACLATGDSRRVEQGQGGFDACGVCMRFTDPRFNQTCAGCDGIPNSGLDRDACGVCNGNTTSTADCNVVTGLSKGEVAAVTGVTILFATAIAFCCLKTQQKQMRNDIDAQIRNYQRMGGSRAENLISSTRVAPAPGPIREQDTPLSEEFQVGELVDTD